MSLQVEPLGVVLGICECRAGGPTRVTWKRMEIGVDVEWSGVHVVLGMLWERRGTAGAPLDSTR